MPSEWTLWRQQFAKLLYAPARDITFRDVEEFCRNPAVPDSSQPESNLVEYKGWSPGAALESLAEKLVKEIVAFANTEGGLILVGVQEEKDSLAGGRRDYPGIIGTLPLEQADSLKQSLEERCRNSTEPSFVPEILVFPRQEGRGAVLLIRVDPDKAERPLLARVIKGEKELRMPLVRVNKQVLPPSWEEIVGIAEKRREDKLADEQRKFMSCLTPSQPPFWYCYLRLTLRGRYYSRQFGALKEFWSSEDIEQLATAVDEEVPVPRTGWKVSPWGAVFHPDFRRLTGPREINRESSMRVVTFTPRPWEEMWKEARKHYQLRFIRLGILEGIVGTPIPNPPVILAGEVFRKVFFMAELFLREEILRHYRFDFQTEGKASLECSVNSPFDTSPVVSGFPFDKKHPPEEKKRSPGVLFQESLELLLPEESAESVAKELTKRFVLACGLTGLEQSIETLGADIMKLVLGGS